MRSSLSWRDALLALAVVAVWGTNFVVVKIVLGALPPLLLAGLRFLVVFLPAAFFLPRPGSRTRDGGTGKVPWSNLAIYGLAIGPGQFGFLFVAMNGHISPGLASLVVQMQVFFTIGLSVWRTGETVARHQIAALLLALAGMGVIALHSGGLGSHNGTTLAGLGLALTAGLGWAVGNQAAREQARRAPMDMLAYVVWSSLFAAPPLLALSLLLEGWGVIRHGLSQATPAIWAIVIWQSAGNTMFGYTVWNRLLARHPAALVTPASLLVPVFGIGASALFLHEPLQAWKIGASLLVIAGLAVNILWRRNGSYRRALKIT
jgi:O-acetylserine/cysteine efflux transporter